MINMEFKTKFKYFTLNELIHSDTADSKGIKNIPNFEEVGHLEELCSKILEPLRIAWKKPINISSGYRCPRLNQLVGGVSTSAHKLGYAVDIVPNSGDIETLKDFIVDWVKDNKIKFDQIIFESKGSSKWIHVGLYNNQHKQRNIIFNQNVKK